MNTCYTKKEYQNSSWQVRVKTGKRGNASGTGRRFQILKRNLEDLYEGETKINGQDYKEIISARK